MTTMSGVKASLIFIGYLKTVWKEGQNGSNSNRYISGINWNFCMRFLHYDPWCNAFKAVMNKQEYNSLTFEL